MHTAGERIRERRRKQGMSQEDLARAAGRTTSTIQKVELGIVTPRVDTAAAIAKALGVTLLDLFDDTAA